MRRKLLRLAGALLALAVIATPLPATHVGEACDMILVGGGIACHGVAGESCEACKFCCVLPDGTCDYHWWNVCNM